MRTIAKIAIATVAAVSAASVPGLGGSISIDGVRTAKNIITPYLFAAFADLQIPEIDFDGGWFKNVDVKIPAPASLDDIQVNMLGASNAIELKAANIKAAVTASFSYKYLFMTVTGDANIKINKMGADFQLGLATQPGTPDSELAPLLKVNNINVLLNSSDIDITLSGSLVSKIANIFIPLIKSSIIPSVLDQATATIKTMIETTIDADLKLYGTQMEIPFLAGVTFDYAQQVQGPLVSDSFLNMDLNGTFFDAQNVQVPAIAPATFNSKDLKGKQLQGYFTDYVLNTMFESGYLTGNTLDVTELLSKLNVTVTTDNLALVIPEVLTKYGSGKAVGLSGKFITAPSSSKIAADGQEVLVNLQIIATIDGEEAINASFNTIAAQGAVNSKSGAIYGKINTASVGDLIAFTNTLGYTAESMKALLQTTVDTYVAQANALLAAGIVIPTVEGINVSDVELDFFDGYLSFGASVSPAFWLQVQSVLGGIKQNLLLAKAFKSIVPVSEIAIIQ